MRKLLFLPALALCSALAVLAAADEPAYKALLVTGGGFHDYDGQTILITEGLKINVPDLEITVAAVESSREAPEVHTAFEEEDWHEGYDLIIYNKCNSGRFTDSDLVERIVAPHRAGLPAVVIHCTMHCFRPDLTGKWNAFLGIESTNHERHAPVKVYFDKPGHPVLADLPETWEYEKGELYRVIAEGENVVPLARGISGDGEYHTIIWTNTYGEGRVFGTTIGHHTETMAEDNFQTLLRNGVLWALGVTGAE